jgi:hypothetical protein
LPGVTLFFFPVSTRPRPDRERGLANLHVHGRIADFCIPKSLCGESSPVSIRSMTCVSSVYACGQAMMPLGFCSGGFSSTAGYVAGNFRSSSPSEEVNASDSRTNMDDHFLLALSVFIRITSSQRADLMQAFRLRYRTFSNSGFPLLPVPERCVTTSVPPSDFGRDARKQSRLCMEAYTHIFRSQVESALTIGPILWAFCGYLVEKAVGKAGVFRRPLAGPSKDGSPPLWKSRHAFQGCVDEAA